MYLVTLLPSTVQLETSFYYLHQKYKKFQTFFSENLAINQVSGDEDVALD
jgi:hypothetical protein